jgi:hypothetical protein
VDQIQVWHNRKSNEQLCIYVLWYIPARHDLGQYQGTPFRNIRDTVFYFIRPLLCDLRS